MKQVLAYSLVRFLTNFVSLYIDRIYGLLMEYELEAR